MTFKELEAKIEGMTKGRESDNVWLIGQQLLDIAEAEPELCDIIGKDLDNKQMNLEAAEKQLKAYADEKHKKVKGNCICVTMQEAEKILREFYGLPKGAVCGRRRPAGETVTENVTEDKDGEEIINLEDFL